MDLYRQKRPEDQNGSCDNNDNKEQLRSTLSTTSHNRIFERFQGYVFPQPNKLSSFFVSTAMLPRRINKYILIILKTPPITPSSYSLNEHYSTIA